MYTPGLVLFGVIAVFSVGLLAIHIGFRAPRRKERGSPADYDLAYREIHIPTAGPAAAAEYGVSCYVPGSPGSR